MDEPPVVSFSPQHQSTCGLLFNEAKAGQRPFGPSSWEGDAFVCGFSRGKLWRVQLVKTPCGYVGRPSLIAAVGLLVLQAALSPAGDLVLACHSGAPDWGNGPSGKGRLFKISYTSPNFPQAALAWSSGPMEACVAFDRPLDPKSTKDLGVASIAYGEHVRAGDRFEIHRPGYKTVAAQMDAPRGALGVGGRKLSPDGRTLVLTTDPHPLRGTYAVTLVGKDGTYDIAYDLAGIEDDTLTLPSVASSLEARPITRSSKSSRNCQAASS